MKVDWKIYAVAIGLVALAILFIFLGKILYLLGAVLVTLTLALMLGFIKPLKYIGIELVTLSSIFVGINFGPIIGGIYSFTTLIAHLVLGRYYIGSYLVWLIPEYVALGVLSGILGKDIIGLTGVVIIVAINSVNLLLTFLVENDRVAAHLPYAIGNTVLNTLFLTQIMPSIV